MNKSRDILEYLKQPGAARTVILAPNAPPIARTYAGVAVVLNTVLDSADISDTLEHLYSNAFPLSEGVIAESHGTFSFSQKGLGRVRVTFARQRGTYVVSVTAIPYDIPKPELICSDPNVAQELVQAVLNDQNVFIAVNGPDSSCTSTFIYSLLQEINENSSKIISIIERRLNYLLGHANSIVIQSELGEDVPSVAHGISVASDFRANLYFVNHIEHNDDHASIRLVLAAGNTVILNSVSQTPQHLSAQYADPIKALLPPEKTLKQFHVRVFTMPDTDKLDIEVESCST